MSAYLKPEDIANQLEGARRWGEAWSARCPSHKDRLASLKISPGSKATLIYCHAGCTAQEILDEMGLGMEQLYHNYDPNSHTNHDSSSSLKLRQMIRDSKAPTMRELAPAHTLEDVLWEVVESDPYTWTWVRLRWADWLSMPFVNAMKKHWIVTDAIAADLFTSDLDNGYDYTLNEKRRLRERLEEQWEQTQPVTGG